MVKAIERERWVLGIDIGGTSIKAALVDRKGGVRVLRSVSSRTGNLPHFRRNFRTLLNALAHEAPRGNGIGAVGIGCKGIIEPETCRVNTLPGHFRFLEGIRLDRLVRQGDWRSMPVASDNDAKAALLGEQRWGAARGKKHVVLLTLGSGVGGAVLADGRMIRGSRHIGGHLGHVTVDFEGPLCSCGNRGCLEALFSARAIEGAALAAVRRGCESLLCARSEEGRDPVTCLDVFSAASRGDPVARSIVRRAVAALAAAMAGMAHAFDPEVFILGGQIADSGSALLSPLRSDFYARTRRLTGRRIPIRRAAFGETAGIVGAAALAWDALEPG